jgi:hypothetical protein
VNFKIAKWGALAVIPAIIFMCSAENFSAANFSYTNVLKPQASTSANLEISTLSLSFSDTQSERYVNSNAVAVKAEPNDESDVIFSLDYADFITVTGDNSNNSYGWVQIELNGQTGYINSSYLSDEMLFMEDYASEMYINQDYDSDEFGFERNDIVEMLGYNKEYTQVRKDGQIYIVPNDILSDEKQPDPKVAANYNYISSDAYIPVIEKAYSLIGTPYGHGCSESLTDCVGLTMMCYEAAGVSLPWSLTQAYCGESVSYEQAVPGDIIVWSPKNSSAITHVGIYVGEGQMIHASSTDGVIVYDVNRYIQYGGNMVDVRHISLD